MRELGLDGTPVSVHASMRSFGRLEAGAETVIDGLLEAGCTVLVPAFSHQFEVAPPPDDRPERNAIDYSQPKEYLGAGRRYTADAPVEPWLGAVPAHLITRPDAVRGGSPVGSFAAVGPVARDLIVDDCSDVFGSLRALGRLGGWVLLMGVGLNRMTLLHLAEVEAGRRPFIRWVNGTDDEPVRIGAGECSEGFPNFEPLFAELVRVGSVGDSAWRAYPAARTIEVAAAAIHSNPEITHCGRDCLDCRDAIAGGPIG